MFLRRLLTLPTGSRFERLVATIDRTPQIVAPLQPARYEWLDAYHLALGRDPAQIKTVSLADFMGRSARAGRYRTHGGGI